MRNDIRPKFHDNATKIRALLKPGGKVVKYKLPIMASDEERRDAGKSGNPFVEEELLFAVRPLRNPSATTLPLREVGELIYWFYKEYLGAECHDVRGQDVNRLLAKALTELSGVEITTEEIAGKGRAALSRIPRNESVTLIKISESEGK